ncbi:MAG: winged helix-turn-helix domain-containing protein [Chloroflexota bacterium]
MSASAPIRTITVENARRLNLARQHLTGDTPPALLAMIRDMGCLQLDPISAMARSHEIVVWSRQGPYDMTDLDHLRFEDFALIEYWAHAASMVLTEDYPLYRYYINRHGTGDDDWAQKLRAWVEAHAALRQHILDRLRDEGPLPSRAFESRGPRGVGSVGWTSGRDITHMIDYLWNSGQVMVARREGTQRLWGLTEHFLPAWTPQEELQPEEITYRAAQRSLRALGVATTAQIKRHFTRKRYNGLARVLQRLEAEGRIQRVDVIGADGSAPWKADTFIHTDDLPLLDRIEAGAFTPRTTLLSPFDNLICDRERTQQLWDFSYRIEIYVPKHKRQFGYYVLPILYGDQLIGRVDPNYDTKSQVLTVHTVYKEDDAPDDPAAVAAVRAAIESLAGWLGAKRIDYGAVPAEWRGLAPD